MSLVRWTCAVDGTRSTDNFVCVIGDGLSFTGATGNPSTEHTEKTWRRRGGAGRSRAQMAARCWLIEVVAGANRLRPFYDCSWLKVFAATLIRRINRLGSST